MKSKLNIRPFFFNQLKLKNLLFFNDFKTYLNSYYSYVDFESIDHDFVYDTMENDGDFHGTVSNEC
jgi:hypothetical protein